MKDSISFASDLVSLVKSRSKIFTYRLGDKYDFLNPGDLIKVDEEGGEIFGELKIISKTQTSFKDLPIDRDGHEKYESKEQQRQIFNTYYGQVNDDDKFLVLEFEFIADE